MCDQIDLIFNYCVNDYAKKYNATLLDDNEKYSYGFVQYKTGEYYSIHSDDAGSQMRKISTTLYLNDDYLGGELFFDKIDFLYKPKMGDLIIFPSSFPFSHEAKPVTSGTKYCVIKFWA
jgi:predicted 2-oxoglutarate/Fe(II)-dependent dioxygenase YbiX